MIVITQPTYTSIEVESEGNEVLITSNDTVEFAVGETGEKKIGSIKTISKVKGGKKEPEHFSIAIIPLGATHTEVWDSNNIAEGSLKLYEGTEA